MADAGALARRQLGARLKHLRENARKTLADVEEAGVGSSSKIWRIESGRTSVRTGDVRELCFLYQVPQRVVGPLLALAKATKGGGWWEDYTDVLFDGVGLYLDLEAAAGRIQTYDAELVHGLLQIPGYHRVIAGCDGLDEAACRRSEELRERRRQQTLFRTEPVQLAAVVGEAALRRVVGSHEIMDEQLRHLRELTAAGRVDLRVLTYPGGVHPAVRGGSFTIMEFFNEADPDIVYLESHTAARYLEQEAQLRAYREVWALLWEQSLPIEEYSS